MRLRNLHFFIILMIVLVSAIIGFSRPWVKKDIPQTGNQSILSGSQLDTLIKQTIRRIGSIERYYQDTELRYEYSENQTGISDNKSLQMTMTAKVDVRNKMLWAAINSTLDEQNNPSDVGVEMYSTGEDLYINMQVNKESVGWVRSKQITSSWNKLVSFDNVQTVLEEEDVRSSRSEVYAGKDCYVLTVPVKDVNTIYSIIRDSYGLENQFRYSYELMQAFSGQFVYEIWIEKATNFILKTVLNMDVDVTPDEVPETEAESATYSLHIVTVNHNMNQNFIIELPKEVEKAPLIYIINE